MHAYIYIYIHIIIYLYAHIIYFRQAGHANESNISHSKQRTPGLNPTTCGLEAQENFSLEHTGEGVLSMATLWQKSRGSAKKVQVPSNPLPLVTLRLSET